MGNYGKIWENMGNIWETYGNIWENMGKYGKIWENMGRYGKIWESYDNPIGIGGYPIYCTIFFQTNSLVSLGSRWSSIWMGTWRSVYQQGNRIVIRTIWVWVKNFQQRTTARLGTFLCNSILGTTVLTQDELRMTGYNQLTYHRISWKSWEDPEVMFEIRSLVKG